MNKKIIIGSLVILLIVLLGYSFREGAERDYTVEESEEIAKEWITEKAPTYIERGGHDLNHVDTETVNNESFNVVFDFKASFAGYGSVDGDEMTAQVITPHTTKIKISSNEIVEATTDGVFDEINDAMIDDNGDFEGDLESVAVELYYMVVTDGIEDIVPVEKEIELVNGIEESAIKALVEEVSEDSEYQNSIPEGTRLLSFQLDGGLAVLDFSEEIQPPGGSAWVSAIRDQITETLTQFDSVDEVDILVDGQKNRLEP